MTVKRLRPTLALLRGAYDWLLVVLLLAALSLAGCASVQVAEEVPDVVMDEQTAAFLTELHRRSTAHATLPDRELLVCLLGKVEGREIIIEAFAAAVIRNATAVSVEYEPCDHPQTIGVYHSHPANEAAWGDGCWFSEADIASFLRVEREIVTVVSCEKDGAVKFLHRVKKGYSRREIKVQ